MKIYKKNPKKLYSYICTRVYTHDLEKLQNVTNFVQRYSSKHFLAVIRTQQKFSIRQFHPE